MLNAVSSISPMMMLGIFAVVLILMIPLYHTYLAKKLQKTTRFKVWCLFRTPAGGASLELCPVRGLFVYRGLRKGEEPRSIKGNDPSRLGRDVYTLSVPNAYRVFSDNGNGTGGVVGEFDDDAELMETLSESGQAVEVITKAKGKTVKTKSSIAQRKALAAAVKDSLRNRPHFMYPINGGGYFSPQVSIPFAEFVEGYSPEIDPVAVAMETFTCDPIFQSDLVGNILDEKLTSLAAWFSNYIETLQKQLAKMLNPNVQLIVYGVMALLLLVSLGLVWTMRGQVASLSSQLDVLKQGLISLGAAFPSETVTP